MSSTEQQDRDLFLLGAGIAAVAIPLQELVSYVFRHVYQGLLDEAGQGDWKERYHFYERIDVGLSTTGRLAIVAGLVLCALASKRSILARVLLALGAVGTLFHIGLVVSQVFWETPDGKDPFTVWWLYSLPTTVVALGVGLGLERGVAALGAKLSRLLALTPLLSNLLGAGSWYLIYVRRAENDRPYDSPWWGVSTANSHLETLLPAAVAVFAWAAVRNLPALEGGDARAGYREAAPREAGPVPALVDTPEWGEAKYGLRQLRTQIGVSITVAIALGVFNWMTLKAGASGDHGASLAGPLLTGVVETGLSIFAMVALFKIARVKSATAPAFVAVIALATARVTEALALYEQVRSAGHGSVGRGFRDVSTTSISALEQLSCSSVYWTFLFVVLAGAAVGLKYQTTAGKARSGAVWAVVTGLTGCLAVSLVIGMQTTSHLDPWGIVLGLLSAVFALVALISFFRTSSELIDGPIRIGDPFVGEV